MSIFITTNLFDHQREPTVTIIIYGTIAVQIRRMTMTRHFDVTPPSIVQCKEATSFLPFTRNSHPAYSYKP